MIILHTLHGVGVLDFRRVYVYSVLVSESIGTNVGVHSLAND